MVIWVYVILYNATVRQNKNYEYRSYETVSVTWLLIIVVLNA